MNRKEGATWPILFALAILMLVLAFLSSGCARGVDGIRQTVTNAAIVQAKMMASFTAYDRQRHEEIVAQANSLDEGEEAFAIYHAQREIIVRAMEDAWLVTANLIHALEAKEQSKDNMNMWVSKVMESIASLKKLLSDFGIRQWI